MGRFTGRRALRPKLDLSKVGNGLAKSTRFVVYRAEVRPVGVFFQCHVSRIRLDVIILAFLWVRGTFQRVRTSVSLLSESSLARR